MTIKLTTRRFTAWLHLWLGMTAGAFICLMGVTGGIVALRPQITQWISPTAPRVPACQNPVDWDRASRQITEFAHGEINRIYGPTGSDSRIRFASTPVVRSATVMSFTMPARRRFSVPSTSAGWIGPWISITTCSPEKPAARGPAQSRSRS